MSGEADNVIWHVRCRPDTTPDGHRRVLDLLGDFTPIVQPLPPLAALAQLRGAGRLFGAAPERHRAATSAHPLLRRTAAQSPHLPPDLLRLLARAEDPLVDEFLARWHPDTPEEVLMRVFARLGGTFSAWIAETHPRFPREGLAARYADHPDGNYRRLAVRDPAATPALIERLSHDPTLWTRQAAARDPRLPLHRLRGALHVPELASSAGANPALPEGEMAAVLDRAGAPA
ncbi:hypothetical protein ABT034_34810 [Streptomyces sp. NPDC002773]|uniref:hypothetical protein n=1 Tax=Streptomyces sp. NPDC002773 TaxID=3154430 RepID=UPI003324C24E